MDAVNHPMQTPKTLAGINIFKLTALNCLLYSQTPTKSEMMKSGNNKTTAFTGDMTVDKSGTAIMLTMGNPPLDMPISKAPMLASIR
jgi:hypothetical protein